MSGEMHRLYGSSGGMSGRNQQRGVCAETNRTGDCTVQGISDAAAVWEQTVRMAVQ